MPRHCGQHDLWLQATSAELFQVTEPHLEGMSRAVRSPLGLKASWYRLQADSN